MDILHDKWTFKIKSINNLNFSKNQAMDEWMNGYKNVLLNIDTIKKFWGLWNNVLGQSKGVVQTKIPYTIHALFKDGIEPVWEDPSNVNGCSMHFYITEPEKIYSFAENIALLCIGNTIENINGSTFDVKPPRGSFGSKWKISIWLSTRNGETVDAIKKYLISETNLENNIITECRIDNHSQ